MEFKCLNHQVTFDPDLGWCHKCVEAERNREEVRRIGDSLWSRVDVDASYARQQMDWPDLLGLEE